MNSHLIYHAIVQGLVALAHAKEKGYPFSRVRAPVLNPLILQHAKAQERRFSAQPITGFGSLS